MPTPDKKSKSPVGGKREGAGRPKGAKNTRTLEIETKARKYSTAALSTLNEIATKGESERARVAAATAILDRGFGRPRQAVEHSGEGGGPLHISVTHRIIDSPAG